MSTKEKRVYCGSRVDFWIEMLHHQDWNALRRKLSFLMIFGWVLIASRLMENPRWWLWLYYRLLGVLHGGHYFPGSRNQKTPKDLWRAGSQEWAFWKVSSIYQWMSVILNLFSVRAEMKTQVPPEEHPLTWEFALERYYIAISLPLTGGACGQRHVVWKARGQIKACLTGKEIFKNRRYFCFFIDYPLCSFF